LAAATARAPSEKSSSWRGGGPLNGRSLIGNSDRPPHVMRLRWRSGIEQKRKLPTGAIAFSTISRESIEVPALVAQTGTVPRARIKNWLKRQQRSGDCTRWCAFAFPPEWTTGVAAPLRMKLLHWGAVGTEVGAPVSVGALRDNGVERGLRASSA
jgi:hypothetical protein